MNAAIVTALAERRRLAFTDNGGRRFVEPQCDGIGAKGTELLRGDHSKGGAQPEPLFDVAKMEEVSVLPEHFDRP